VRFPHLSQAPSVPPPTQGRAARQRNPAGQKTKRQPGRRAIRGCRQQAGPDSTQRGSPPGSPAGYLKAISFDWMVPGPSSFPCIVLVAVVRAAARSGAGAAARWPAGGTRRRRALPAMIRPGNREGHGNRARRRPPGGRERIAGARRDPGRRGRRRCGRPAERRRDQRVELGVHPLLIRVHDVRERRACLAGGKGHADHPPGNLR
jgi:hypothetical protein